MIDITVIDVFLKKTLRESRAGETSPWPQSNGDGWEDEAALNLIWSRIDVHGIAVVLHSKAEQLENWPDALKDRIAEEARLLALWEITHASALSKLIAQFSKANVESVVMKGTALAYSLYEEPSARRRGDSDLLIKPSDVDRARSILRDAGWYRGEAPVGLSYQEAWLHDTAGHFVHALDLHWRPSERPVIQEVLRAEDFFAHKEPLDRLAPNAFRADHPLTMIHETVNQKWHEIHGYFAEDGRILGTRRLIWSQDFDLLIQDMNTDDWNRLTKLCTDRGIGPLVAEAMRNASNDLNTSLPEPVLAILEASPLKPVIAQHFATTDKFGEFWLDLRTAHTWREKGRLLANRTFPPREHLLKKFPQKTNWPTPLLQGLSLFHNAGRVLGRAVGL